MGTAEDASISVSSPKGSEHLHILHRTGLIWPIVSENPQHVALADTQWRTAGMTVMSHVVMFLLHEAHFGPITFVLADECEIIIRIDLFALTR